MTVTWVLSALTFLFRSTYAKVPCDPESFKFVDSPRITEPFGVYTFRISNAAEIGCAINVIYDWTLYHRGRYNDLTKIPEETNALRYPGRSKAMVNKVDMGKIPQIQDGSDRVFALKVVLIPDPTHYPSYRLWIFGPDVDLSNKVAIFGGRERTHWLDGTSLWLNATGTQGDDLLAELSNPIWDCFPPFKGIIPPKTLKWEIPEYNLIENMTHKCILTVDLPFGQSKSVSQIIHIKSLAKVPLVEVRCLKNCEEPAKANEETILTFYCHGRPTCEGTVNWAVKPYSDSYMKGSTVLPNSNAKIHTISFKGNTFLQGSTMDFLAVLGEATANYTIHYGLQKPQIKIMCIENCESLDPRLTTRLQAVCTSECEGFNYFWEIRPISAKPWSLNSPKNDIITFPPNSFSPKTSVSLYVLAGGTKVENQFSMGSGSIPFLRLYCYVNCDIFDPRLPLELRIECISNCVGERDYSYWWRVSVPRPGFHWYEHTLNGNRTLVVPANTYRDTDYVEFGAFGGFGNHSAMITFHIEKARLVVRCIENCIPDENHPNPHRPVKLSVTCSSECNYGPYSWRLDPEPGTVNYALYQVSENGTFFTILADQYKEGQSVRLSVMKGTGEASATINFKKMKPKLEVRCVKNCARPSDPMMNTVLQVDCLANCEEVSIEWRPMPKPDLWYDHFELGKHNRTLTIKRGTYDNSAVVDFGVFTKNDVEEHLILRYGSTSRFMVQCAENCNMSWVSHKTVLRVKCYKNCKNLGYEWNIKPEPEAWKWAKYIKLSPNNTTLTIMPFTFKQNDKITFAVKSRRQTAARTLGSVSERQAELQSEISIQFEELPAALKLACEPIGCNRAVNRLQSVLMNVSCKINCNRTKFVWEIIPLPIGFAWDINTIRGIENKTLEILPDTFKDGSNITFIVSSGEGKTSAFLVFKDPAPEFLVVCEGNCNPSNPHNPLNLRVKCILFCDDVDVFLWEFFPEANVVFGPKKQVVKVLADTYKDGDIVTATAQSGTWSSSLKLAFVAPAPVLDIVCFRNCGYDPKIATFLKIRCRAGCYLDMPYEWTLIPPPKKKEIYFHNNIIMSLPVDSYEDSSKVSVTLVSGKGRTSKILLFKSIKPSTTLQFECDSLICENLGGSLSQFDQMKSGGLLFTSKMNLLILSYFSIFVSTVNV